MADSSCKVVPFAEDEAVQAQSMDRGDQPIDTLCMACNGERTLLS